MTVANYDATSFECTRALNNTPALLLIRMDVEGLMAMYRYTMDIYYQNATKTLVSPIWMSLNPGTSGSETR